MSGVTLLRPEWLLALLPLAGFAVWLLRRPAVLGGWSRAVRPELLGAMAALGKVETARTPWRRGAVFASAVLCILGLAGPAVERREALSFRNLDAVIFVLDVSDAMTTRDDWPDVLALGRFAIAALGTRPGALVVYGGDAYVATDLTRDHTQLGQTFSLIEPGLVPDPGARPDLGLALAERMLRDGQILTADVVLITSGAGADLVRAPQSAAARLRIVSPQGAAGGGAYAFKEIDRLTQDLRANARTVLRRDDYPLLYWRDLGRYVMLAAALPLLLLFRREAP